MNINTITCHRAYNYGAALQAYALKTYLQSLGHCVQILNYQPDYLTSGYNFWFVSRDSKYYHLCQKSKLCHFVYGVRNYIFYRRTIGRKVPFDEFLRLFLQPTQKIFKSNEELRKEKLEANVFIAGSDQIWNSEMANGKDPAFYLDFAPSNTKKISYAASFGIRHISDELKAFVREKLCSFEAISVREKSGLCILEELGIEKAVQVLDPVFLLSQEEWQSLCESVKIKNAPYLFLYDLSPNDSKLEKLAQKIAQEQNLQIVSVCDNYLISYADKNISNAGPLEFLAWLKHANVVISNSFHATAFSVIFQKEFYTFGLKGQNNQSRMKDFLELIGLSERFLTECPNHLNELINYENITYKLNQEIKKSKDFLTGALV